MAGSTSACGRSSSALPGPRRISSPASGRRSPRSRAPTCICRQRRTSMSAAGWPVRSINTLCRTPIWMSYTAWAPKVLEKLRSLSLLRDVATDQQMAGTTASLTIDRDQASRFGISPAQIDSTLYDAFGQNQITQYFSQVNSYHLILEVMPDQLGELKTLEKLYVRSASGAAVPLSTFVKVDT